MTWPHARAKRMVEKFDIFGHPLYPFVDRLLAIQRDPRAFCAMKGNVSPIPWPPSSEDQAKLVQDPLTSMLCKWIEFNLVMMMYMKQEMSLVRDHKIASCQKLRRKVSCDARNLNARKRQRTNEVPVMQCNLKKNTPPYMI